MCVRIIYEKTKGDSADPDLQIRGGPGLQKKFFFRPSGPQFGLKIRGGGEEAGPPGLSPGSDTGRIP